MAGKPIADYNILFAVPFLFCRERRFSYYHFTVMRRMCQPTDKPSQIIEPLYFLREREIVHYQRFGECLEIMQAIKNGRSAPSCRGARRRW